MSSEKLNIEKELDKKKVQLRRGILELCVMSIISEGEIYSSDIIVQLKEHSELELKEGTLYPLLMRLKNSGLLHYNWRESKSGPPRKYYHITDMGREFLEGLLATWHNLVRAVDNSTKNLMNQKE